MKTSYGYAGNILYVNLTDGSVRKEPLGEDLARAFIGGMGIGGKLAYDLIKPGSDSLSPDNVLTYGAGPFVGTLVPGASKVDAIGKSPLIGFLGVAGCGNSIGVMLKYAGYDHLVITGRAETPVYLKIFDDEIQVHDASHLWGKGVWETTDALWEELGDCWVSCIGPGGEALVRYACITDNKLGMYSRGGLGAVMGSKNLKAIAVRGTKGIQVADGRRFKKIVDEVRENIDKSRLTGMWRQLGFMMALDGYSATGLTLLKNFSQGYEELPRLFSQQEYVDRIFESPYACTSCPVGCKATVNVKDGKYAGLTFNISSPGAQVIWHTFSGVENWDEVVKCVEQQDIYGLDSAAVCGLVGFAIELYERGIITKEDTGGLELKWNGETLRALTEKIVRREDIGDILAEGIVRACEKLGKGSEEYAMHVKGLNLALDLRGRLSSTEVFGQLTNPRGAHMDRATSLTFTPRKVESIKNYCLGIKVPQEAIERIFTDGPEGFNVARLTKWVEDYNSICISMGFCNRPPIAQYFNLETLTELYSAATGIEISPAELLKAGERIFNMHRAFNAREGARRRDDMPPRRTLKESLVISGKEIPPLSEGLVNQLLDEYYDEREWDKESGMATKQKLVSLGLGSVAEDLARIKI